jgi:hypothetical protein
MSGDNPQGASVTFVLEASAMVLGASQRLPGAERRARSTPDEAPLAVPTNGAGAPLQLG